MSQDKGWLLEMLAELEAIFLRMIEGFFRLPDFFRDIGTFLHERFRDFWHWIEESLRYLGEVTSRLCRIALVALIWLAGLIVPPGIFFWALPSFWPLGIGWIGLYLAVSAWGLKRLKAKPQPLDVESLAWTSAEVSLE
jgi:hypothetical protein